MGSRGLQRVQRSSASGCTAAPGRDIRDVGSQSNMQWIPHFGEDEARSPPLRMSYSSTIGS